MYKNIFVQHYTPLVKSEAWPPILPMSFLTFSCRKETNFTELRKPIMVTINVTRLRFQDLPLQIIQTDNRHFILQKVRQCKKDNDVFINDPVDLFVLVGKPI